MADDPARLRRRLVAYLIGAALAAVSYVLFPIDEYTRPERKLWLLIPLTVLAVIALINEAWKRRRGRRTE